MWGRKNKEGRGRIGAFLGEGSEIEGKYACTGTVMLDGRVHGEISSTDTLLIGEHGVVHARVSGAILVVHGQVVGDVIASERVELKKTACVIGDIEAPVIVMEEGAMHEGGCRMRKASVVESSPVLVALKA